MPNASTETAKPISCTRIVTPGYEGWGNLVYDGPDGYLCFAMVPPMVADEMERLIEAGLKAEKERKDG